MFLSKNLLFLLSGALFSNLTSAKPITTITTKCSSSTSHSNSTSLSTSTFHSASPTSKPTSTTTLVPGTHTSNPAPGSSCSGQNGPTNRCAWKDDWSINTDYEAVTPDGGKTVTYELSITNVSSVSPDGVSKPGMLINGQYPGPTIVADWGDTIVVNVHNQLQDNGTSMHWHGLRQFHTNEMDGTNGVTECPIPPGASRRYTFQATQYGTSWYHSHFTVQYGDGVLGAIQINGPASANYDIDLGPYAISDWYHQTADQELRNAATSTTGPPPSDNVLFNGTNINPSGSGGKYSTVTLAPGKKHLLRLINTSVENHFTLSLAGHNFTVIANDLVPVQPTVKNELFMAIGQRYDVIIDASQPVDSYWFNATLAASGACGRSNNKAPAAIFAYQGAEAGLPANAGPTVAATCDDATGLTPVVARSVEQADFAAHLDELNVDFTTAGVDGLGPFFAWKVNSSSMDVSWEKPTLQYVEEGNTSYPVTSNLISLDTPDTWTYWVIDNLFPVPHPIHLHGHEFLVLGASAPGVQAEFDRAADAAGLQFANPRRRDVAMLPGGGWLVLAFKTDNPGAWLMHCHIAWHVSQGLSVQFLERAGDIPSAVDLGQIRETCQAWDDYVPHAFYPKLDSGL